MKLLNTVEITQVSGGSIITIGGKSINVNTAGIPQHCVDSYDAMFQAIAVEADNPNLTMESAFTTVGRHLDLIQKAGCAEHLAVFSERLRAARPLNF